MRMRLGNLRISLDFAGPSSFSTFEISEANRTQLSDRWSPLPLAPDPSLQAQVTVRGATKPSMYETAQKILFDHGIAVIPDFIPRSIVNAVREEADQLSQMESNSNTSVSPNQRIAIEYDDTISYTALAKRKHATMVIRSGSDNGMRDVFNFEAFSHKAGRDLLTKLKTPALMPMLLQERRVASLTNLNLYINSGVTATRMFHVDSYDTHQTKAFVYMTDVNDVTDGPYTYVLGSHVDGPWRRLNQAITACGSGFHPTDAPLVDPTQILPILAPAGSLIISNQNGFHRGYPQKMGGYRVVAVLNTLAR